MIGHDAYGKMVLREACRITGDTLTDIGRRVPIYGCVSCDIDGVLGCGIAVEIESRTPKQIRGAMLDLALHPCSLKLLILIPAYIGAPERARNMCEVIAERICPANRFICVVVTGTGDKPQMEWDTMLVAEGIRTLKCHGNSDGVGQDPGAPMVGTASMWPAVAVPT